MATLKVISDWTAASFLSAGEITTYVKSYSLNRGRSSELDRVSPGTLTLVLDNPDGLFSPANTSSSLSGSLVPYRSIYVDWTLSGSTFRRFRGKINRYSPEPTVSGERTVIIECVDEMDNWQRQETRSTLYTNVLSGSLIQNILNNAKFPAASSGSRFIDDGQDTYPYAYFDQRKIDEVLNDIVRTEYGTGFIRGDGAYVFHDRHYRSINATASATFNENMTNATYSRDIADIYTEARVNTLPRITKASTTIWTLQSPITISPSSTASWFGNYIDPTTCATGGAQGVASPIIGTGLLFNSNASGTGTVLSASLTASFTAFAESFKIVASNAGNTAGYIYSMTVTGCPIVTHENISRSWVDATACTLYGLRTLTYDATLVTDPEQAQAFAQFLISRYSDPANTDRATITIVNDDATDWEHILRRDLDSRITLTISKLGITSQDYFIGRLDESYDSNSGLHQVTYALERTGVTDQLFLINISIVNGTGDLGY